MVSNEKPHAVMVPFPAQGHIMPFMILAKLLHTKGFHITFVHTEFNHKRLIRSSEGVGEEESVKGLDDFRFVTIPDGLPPSEKDATQDAIPLCDSTRKNCLAPFKVLLAKLINSSSSPPVSCVIADGSAGFAVKAAKDLGIPDAQFFISSACSFIAFLHFPELVKRKIVPFPNDDYLHDGTLQMPIDWIAGMTNVKFKDLPSFVRTTDPDDVLFDFLGTEIHNCLKSSALIINTFDELEHEALDAIKNHFNFPNIYTVGPLHLLAKNFPENRVNSLNASLWKSDSNVFDWLDMKEPKSVVYVSYGSITKMSIQHFQEFARGLALSKQNFLWILRPDVVQGESTLIPEDFLQEIKERGMITSWCAQEQVLAHPSIGAFLTHCGWNSMMEALSAGVPLICWPFFAEQQTSCHYACEKWGIGVEIDHDVKRSDVASRVREMMEGEEVKRMRKTAQDWKKKAEQVTGIEGPSYTSFDKFIREALHFKG